jgi:hypothetical protein
MDWIWHSCQPTEVIETCLQFQLVIAGKYRLNLNRIKTYVVKNEALPPTYQCFQLWAHLTSKMMVLVAGGLRIAC